MQEIKNLLPTPESVMKKAVAESKKIRLPQTLFKVQYPVGMCQECGRKLYKMLKGGWVCRSKSHKYNKWTKHL